MDNRVKEIEELIKLISKFPGLGPKSARRVALHLLKNKDTIVKPLSQSLTDVYNNWFVISRFAVRVRVRAPGISAFIYFSL